MKLSKKYLYDSSRLGVLTKIRFQSSIFLFSETPCTSSIQQFKVGLSPSKKVVLICFNESHLKMMKNAFLVYVKRYLNFSPDFLVIEKNGLIRKLRLISKFMTSQTGQKIITKHILSNISKSKGNQAIIEYNLINIFLEKSYRKYSGEASPRPIYRKSKLRISLDQKSEML